MFFALFIALQQEAATAAPTVEVPRIEDAIVTVDGVLDEPAWSNAARLTGFWQYEPVDGRPAAEETEVLVWYAPDAIHFGIIAHDSDPGTIRATVADRDNIGNDDHVILYLDTFNDQRRAFFFGVNPLGAQQDGVRTEGAVSAGRLFGGSVDTSPDYRFESEGRITDVGYMVEVRIPFKSLRYPGGEPQRWGLQVERMVQRTGHTYTWTAARRASASFLAQSGTLVGLRDLERGVVLEAQPFLTATANGLRGAGTGSFEREPLDTEAGINMRVGFTNLSLDATINPDFSQVEADVGQVTINERFALFFPEKRPFFLEGIELFATPNQLVHTRRVVDPVAGGKVTGKVGGIGVAHLTALDHVGGTDALFNITRLRRDFGENSVAGIVFTDRSVLDTDVYNRVLAADVRYVFGRMYYVEAQFGRSWTRAGAPGAGGTDGSGLPGGLGAADPSRSAPIWNLSIDRTGRGWGFNYRLNGIGDGFAAEAGFVPRPGIVDAHGFNRFTLYGAPGALIENLTVFFGPTRVWAYDEIGPGDAIEGGESANVMLQLRGGWRFQTELSRDFFVLDPAAYAAYETTIGGGVRAPYSALDEVAGMSVNAELSTPTYRGFDASLSSSRGTAAIFDEGAEGDATAVTGALALRPDASVRLAFSTTFERITRHRDGSEFARTILPRVQAVYQPTPAFFLRAIAEYRSERRAALRDARTGAPLHVAGAPAGALRTDALRLDLLASYEPTPGTVAFLGYGATLGTDAAFAFRRLERSDDGFFIKVAYRWRR